MAKKELNLEKLSSIKLVETEAKVSEKSNKKERTVSTTVRYTKQMKRDLDILKLNTDIDKQDLMFEYIKDGIARDLAQLKEKGIL